MKVTEEKSISSTASVPEMAMARSSGDEVASLLDSCDSGEEDCESVVASGSEYYSQYVGETGRREDEVDNDFHTMSDNNKIAAAVVVRDVTLSALPRLNGLAFDMNQPWERSLMRQLEEAEHESEKPRRRELMLIGHTESRDYGMDLDGDDTVSLDTSASSTVPTKAQLIHRTILNRDPRVIGYHQQTQQETLLQAKLHDDAKRKGRESETSSMTSATIQSEEDRDEVSSPTGMKIPASLPGRRRKPEQQQGLLEMEPSANGDEEYTATTYVDPGCFCLGFDVLNYVLPPPDAVAADYSKMRFGTRTTTRLSRVEEDPMPEVIDLTSVKAYRNAYRRSEPKGIFEPTGKIYMTRQGVDL